MATLKSFALCAVFVTCILAWISESHAVTHPYPFYLRKSFPWWNPKYASCMAALGQSTMPCKPQLVDSYLSLNVSISSECCKTIQEIEKECGSLTGIIFPRFNTRLVYLLLKEYCGKSEGCQPEGFPQPVAPAPRPAPSPEPISPAPEPSAAPSTSPPPEQSSDEPISPAPAPSVGEPVSPVPVPSYIESPAPGPSDDDDEPTSPVTEPIGEEPVVFPPVLVMPPDTGDYDPLDASSPAIHYEPSPY